MENSDQAEEWPRTWMLPMRDGVRLHTRIWHPAGRVPHPVVLHRGYVSGIEEDAHSFVAAGYVYVGQATRGHEHSEGENERFFADGDDGYDTLDAIARQPWCNGQIAMYGRSYMAATQWLVAPKKHPSLKAIIPQHMNADLWERCYWCHGALTLAMTALGRAIDLESARRVGWWELLRHLPLIDLDEAATGHKNKLWRDYITHSSYDDFWRQISIGKKYSEISIPVFLMSGWYDYYTGAAFYAYRELKKYSPEVRIVVSASDHKNRIVGDRPLPGGEKDQRALAIRWLDFVLRGIKGGIENEPPVQVFVMGVNSWRGEGEWPIAGTSFTKYFFRPGEDSRSGVLSLAAPRNDPPSSYTYDPADPVPTLGGNHSFTETGIPEIIRAGPVDQRPNEERADVLVFTSAPLTKAVEVTGPVVAKVYAASSALDTDFTAKLIDVHPDGTAYNLTEGILRARFRDGVHEPPRLLEPGRIYEYRVELLPTSNVFFRGHRIRVHLSSSSFPLWDRNPNTGHRQGMDCELRVAQQRIYHDRRRSSHIVLPIIPSRR